MVAKGEIDSGGWTGRGQEQRREGKIRDSKRVSGGMTENINSCTIYQTHQNIFKVIPIIHD